MPDPQAALSAFTKWWESHRGCMCLKLDGYEDVTIREIEEWMRKAYVAAYEHWHSVHAPRPVSQADLEAIVDEAWEIPGTWRKTRDYLVTKLLAMLGPGEPTWCSHIQWEATAGTWMGDKDQAEGVPGVIPFYWTVCPVCQAARPR